VDDDAEVRRAVGCFLAQLCCQVTEPPDAEKSLRILEDGPEPELLLSDIALGPGMRGTELAAKAQALLPALRVVLMSGYSADLLDADRLSPPTWELLRKPYSREELAAAMSRVLEAP